MSFLDVIRSYLAVFKQKAYLRISKFYFKINKKTQEIAVPKIWAMSTFTQEESGYQDFWPELWEPGVLLWAGP